MANIRKILQGNRMRIKQYLKYILLISVILFITFMLIYNKIEYKYLDLMTGDLEHYVSYCYLPQYMVSSEKSILNLIFSEELNRYDKKILISTSKETFWAKYRYSYIADKCYNDLQFLIEVDKNFVMQNKKIIYDNIITENWKKLLKLLENYNWGQ